MQTVQMRSAASDLGQHCLPTFLLWDAIFFFHTDTCLISRIPWELLVKEFRQSIWSPTPLSYNEFLT